MNLQDVMERLGQRYASCSTYSDCGTVSCMDDDVDKNFHQRFVFKTFLERPKKFRFEWKQEIPIQPSTERNFNIVWCDGSQVASSYDFEPGPTIEKNLAYAIAGATGISMGSAFEVPSLLIPEVRVESKHMLLLKDLRLSESETIGDQECFQIVGSIFRPLDTILWISKLDFSLKKMKQHCLITAAEFAHTAAELRIEHNNETKNGLDSEHVDKSFCTTLTYDKVSFNTDLPFDIFNYESS